MRLMLALAVAGIAVLPSRGTAQGRWGLGVEAGIVRFWGATGPLPGAEEIALRPYRPTVIGVRLDRTFGALRGALAVRFAQSALGGEYEGGATIFSDGFTMVELAPEGSYAVAHLGSGSAFRAFAGPVLAVWTLSEEPARTRLGVRAGLELDAPLGVGIGAVTRLFAGVSGSAFAEEEIPPGYEVRSMPSAGVSLGLRMGL